ncbi:UDP-glycosyltransferase UGT5-like [Pieris brassicae]|uniref:UDP-glycosyltransferase UGT5-like n=1 Tax=Pieris brassicae TaxID=7116 RepID=UPI001E65E738|nr:UDP-glycosyltransferase UGT5-like [Pieris brassicae]
MHTLTILVLSYALTVANTAKILAVFPTPSVSHQVVFRPLMQELARRGHDLTIITTDPIYSAGNSPKNFTEIDVRDISYRVMKENLTYNVKLGKKSDIYDQMERFVVMNTNLASVQLKHQRIQDLINGQEKFDLIFVEAWQTHAYYYSYIFKAPVILISSYGMFGNEDTAVGALTHPFLFPKLIQQRTYNLTFWEKAQELYRNLFFRRLWSSMEIDDGNIWRQILGINVPDFKEINNNIDMMFLNAHPMWISNQPLPPNVITIWGIYKNQRKALPTDLQNYLDSSKNGVIYLSFGSNVLSSVLSPDRIQLFVRVFARLKYDVLWKWEKPELPGKSENIKISKWLPQSDLLRHPNIKLFITQGGLQSTDEAITAGVPTIGVPMLGDQWFNSDRYVYFKIGMKLDMESLTEEELETAIHTVIDDTSYRENTVKLRTLMEDQPQSALDRAVWWTEYVLRHGGAKHLRSANANMSWIEYYEVEFVLKLASLLLISLVIVATVLYYTYISLITKQKLKTY